MMKQIKGTIENSKNEIQSAINITKKISPQTQKSISTAVDYMNKYSNEINNTSKQIDKLGKKMSNIKPKQVFDPNDISGMKINFHNDAKNKKSTGTIENVPKPKETKQDKLYADWGKGIISLKQIKAYQNQIGSEISKNTNKQNIFTEITKKLYAVLDMIKAKYTQLKSGIQSNANKQNQQNKTASGLKEMFKGSSTILERMKNGLSKVNTIIQKVSVKAKNIGNGFKSGLKHVLKYAMALFSLRGIYSVLSNSASSWLSSQNSIAKQSSANIEYMKYVMGSVFAPVIQYVINLVYQLMKAIQGVVYALSGVNIFANASAKSYNAMATSAKKAKKETQGLADIDEIHNIQKDNGSDSGSETTAPNMDLSNVDSQLSPLAQKLTNFFKPLMDSWNKYGSNLIAGIKTTATQTSTLVSSVWGSFEKIITNGTVYKSLELILAIIGNIAQAFSNAWNYNGNGDAIVQNLANAFNNLLGAINNVVQSPEFQEWLKNCSDKFREISEKIAEIDWQPLVEAISTIGKITGTIALNVLNGLVDIFKWLVEHPEVAEFITGIAIALGLIVAVINLYNTAMGIYNAIMPIATAVSTAFGISVGWLIAIIVGIIIVIGLLVVAGIAIYKNWDKIKAGAEKLWNKLKSIFQKIGDFIGKIFKRNN